MLQETILRLKPLSTTITVVTGEAHRDAVCAQIEELGVPVNVIVEPSGRDSMPAIGLAAALLKKHHGPDAVIGSFAADHDIADPENFRSAVSDAIGAAREGYLTTIGIAPWAPSSAFGYIEPATEQVAQGCNLVAKFVEKPSEEVAEQYLADGYLWNAGMFIFRAGTFLQATHQLHPQMAADLQTLADHWEGLNACEGAAAPESMLPVWERLPRIAIDHALAEPLAAQGRVAVAPASMDWNDVGDFTGLPNASAQPSPVLINSEESVVIADKQVVVIGVPGAVVVDTGDALLVTTKEWAQDVKDAPARLKDLGRSELT